jgi:hypothetical protein
MKKAKTPRPATETRNKIQARRISRSVTSLRHDEPDVLPHLRLCRWIPLRLASSWPLSVTRSRVRVLQLRANSRLRSLPDSLRASRWESCPDLRSNILPQSCRRLSSAAVRRRPFVLCGLPFFLRSAIRKTAMEGAVLTIHIIPIFIVFTFADRWPFGLLKAITHNASSRIETWA